MDVCFFQNLSLSKTITYPEHLQKVLLLGYSVFKYCLAVPVVKSHFKPGLFIGHKAMVNFNAEL